jgi:hypothetical protein
MSTPQITDAVEEQQAPNAAQMRPSNNAVHEQKPDYPSYIKKALSWNDYALQPWRIAALVQGNKVYAVIERKELNFELLDWFEDTRVGAVMRGEKIVPPSEFWFQLYRQGVGAIQQHFGSLPVHVVDVLPAGKHNVFFGTKIKKSQETQPSPVATKPQNKQKKRTFKPRA